MISGINEGTRAGVINSCQCVYSTANIASVIGTNPYRGEQVIIVFPDSNLKRSAELRRNIGTQTTVPLLVKSGCRITRRIIFSSLSCYAVAHNMGAQTFRSKMSSLGISGQMIRGMGTFSHAAMPDPRLWCILRAI